MEKEEKKELADDHSSKVLLLSVLWEHWVQVVLPQF